MTPQEYIVSKAKELATKFPFVSVRYEDHFQSNTHFVEIEPIEFYEMNEDFLKWEEQIVFEFMDLYADQSISFISKESLVGIDKVDFEIKAVPSLSLPDFNFSSYWPIEIKVDWNIPQARVLKQNRSISILINNERVNLISNPRIHYDIEKSEGFYFEINKSPSLHVEEVNIEPQTDNLSFAMAA